MKTTLFTALTLCSSLAFAAPNFVTCYNTSSPLSYKDSGTQGFGITHRFPEEMVIVQDFFYDKQNEQARMDVIAGGVVYTAAADCSTKIKQGVQCVFDLTLQATGSIKPTDAAPLEDYLKRLYVNVLDKDIDKEIVKVVVGMDDTSSEPTHPFTHTNMISFDNNPNGVNNCKGSDTVEQG